jgi:MFS family permease
MLRAIVPVFSLLLGTLLLLIANGIQSMIMPLRGQWEGFTLSQLGLLGTGWASGFVVGCILIPRLIGRIGHIRALAAFSSIGAVAALISGLVVDPLPWILMRCVTGFIMAGSSMVIESWLNDRATNQNRGLVFGLYLMVTYVGIMIGQMSVYRGSFLGPDMFVISGVLYCLALLPTVLSSKDIPDAPQQVRLDIGALWRNSPMAVVACFLIGIANGCFGTLGAVYASRIGLGASMVGVMMSIAVIAGAFVQIPIGRLSDKMDRRYVLAVAAAGGALAGLLLLVIRPVDPWLVLPMIAVYGAMAYALYSVAVAHANDFAGPEDFVKISGGLLLLYGAGTMAGPLLGAKAMEAAGPEGLFLITSAAQALICVYALVRTFKRAAIADNIKGLFRSMLSERVLTTETAQLDPRTDHQQINDDIGVSRD